MRGRVAEPANVFMGDLPMLLIIGSMATATRRDVLAYARGLAESQVIAKDACYVDAMKIDGRWIFEVHEGGGGCRIAPWVAQQIAGSSDGSASIPLLDGRVAVVSELGGEVTTIIYPPDEARFTEAAANARRLGLRAGSALRPFLGSARAFRNAAISLFGVSVLVLMFAGSMYFVRSNAVDVARFAGVFAKKYPEMRTPISDIPSVQLDIAAKNIKYASGYLSYLKYKDGRWTSAQAAVEDVKRPAEVE